MHQGVLFCLILLPVALAVGNLPIYKGCGAVIRDVPAGIIDYPGNGRRYPNNANCFWNIQLAEGDRMEVSFQEFATSNKKDTLFVTDQGTFSGKKEEDLPPTFQTSGNDLTLYFSSNAKHRNTGFRLTWKKIYNTDTPVSRYYGPYTNIWSDNHCKNMGLYSDKSLAECVDICNMHINCNALNFNDEEEKCVLHVCALPVPQPLFNVPPWLGYSKSKVSDKTDCKPAMCEMDNGVVGNCSRDPIDNFKNVSRMQCQDGCDCWIPDQTDCQPAVCEMVNGVVGNCSRCPIDNFKNVGTMQCNCKDGCDCWIPEKIDCKPALCKMVNGVVGKCSRGPIDNFKNVGTMQCNCKDGCDCWIPEKIDCKPALCKMVNGVVGKCSRGPIDNFKNVGTMQCNCKDGCDCWIPDKTVCKPAVCKMDNGVVGNCSRDPIDNFKNVSRMQCQDGCDCWIPDFGIVYRYTSYYNKIWTRAESDRYTPVSIWSAGNYQPSYCSLGDIAIYSFPDIEPPIIKAILVSAKNSGYLVNPTSFSLMWTNAGSGADSECAVYKMNAPVGYTCLGGVAVGSRTSQPDRKNYCCVKDEYTTPGEFVLAYKGHGLTAKGIDEVTTLWTIVNADAFGLDGGNFLPVIGMSAPPTGYLLKWDGVKVRDVLSMPDHEKTPLNLYEISEFDKIWEDAESRLFSSGLSIWRAKTQKGHYSIGDIVVSSLSQPSMGYVVSPSDPNDHNALRHPVSYSLILNYNCFPDDSILKIWRVICPGGYITLGNVATKGTDPYPEKGQIYCVKGTYAVPGTNTKDNYKLVSEDTGKCGKTRLKIFEVMAATHRQQTVKGFEAIALLNGYPGTPWLLDKGKVNYYAEPPIKEIDFLNVQYHLDKEDKPPSNPLTVFQTDIENCSDLKQSSQRTITATKQESHTFGSTRSNHIGIKVTMAATIGIPAISKEKTTFESSYSHDWSHTMGTSSTKSTSDTITATITVPPKSKITVVINAKKYKSNIPYTATMKTVYVDDTYSYGTIEGVYKGVAITDHVVNYGKVEPLPCSE